jgi:hypothetical protein
MTTLIERHEELLRKTFPISNIQMVEIRSYVDRDSKFLELMNAERNAITKNIITCVAIEPDIILLGNVLTSMNIKYTYFPEGIEKIKDHELSHLRAAVKIKRGHGIVNSLGINPRFDIGFRILVQPHYSNKGEQLAPITLVDTSVYFDEQNSEDEKLSTLLEIIDAAKKSQTGLSPNDSHQIAQILTLESETTPLLTQTRSLLGYNPQ